MLLSTLAHRPVHPSVILASCSAFALLLSACESSGGTRIASVGSTPANGGGTTSGGGSSSNDNGSNGSGAGGSNSNGSGGTGSGGTGSGGAVSGGTGQGILQQVSPVLVTAGNAVLGVSDGQGKITTPIATALPTTQPVTGTITRVLDDAGTVLVNAGEGRTLLLKGAQGVVGDIVSVDIGSHTITTGLNGSPGAIGVGVLGNTQPVGTIATAGVLNAGDTARATVNGIADVQVTNITAPTGGTSNELLNVALSGNQLLGSGEPALVNANVLPGGVTNPVGNSPSSVLGSTVQTVTEVLSPVGISAGAAATADTSAAAGANMSPGGAATSATQGVVGTVNGALGTLGLSR